MILKRTIRYISYAIVFLGLNSLEACKDEPSDLCYECVGEIYGDPVDETICFSDYKDYYTKEEFIDYIEYFEDYASGNECNKK